MSGTADDPRDTCSGCHWYDTRAAMVCGQVLTEHLCVRGCGEFSTRDITSMASDIPLACSDRYCGKKAK